MHTILTKRIWRISSAMQSVLIWQIKLLIFRYDFPLCHKKWSSDCTPYIVYQSNLSILKQHIWKSVKLRLIPALDWNKWSTHFYTTSSIRRLQNSYVTPIWPACSKVLPFLLRRQFCIVHCKQRSTLLERVAPAAVCRHLCSCSRRRPHSWCQLLSSSSKPHTHHCLKVNAACCLSRKMQVKAVQGQHCCWHEWCIALTNWRMKDMFSCSH